MPQSWPSTQTNVPETTVAFNKSKPLPCSCRGGLQPPLLVGCCGIKHFGLIYPREMEAQTDGREHKPSRVINPSRAALPALLSAGISDPSGISARVLSCVRVPFPGEGTHPAPQACCTPASSRLCSPPGTAPSRDQGTKLQPQRVSHFPSLLSHIQGNVPPPREVSWKNGKHTRCWDEAASKGCVVGSGTGQPALNLRSRTSVLQSSAQHQEVPTGF